MIGFVQRTATPSPGTCSNPRQKFSRRGRRDGVASGTVTSIERGKRRHFKLLCELAYGRKSSLVYHLFSIKHFSGDKTSNRCPWQLSPSNFPSLRAFLGIMHARALREGGVRREKGPALSNSSCFPFQRLLGSHHPSKFPYPFTLIFLT